MVPDTQILIRSINDEQTNELIKPEKFNIDL